MILFYTFCVYFKRHTKNELILALKKLLSSIHKTNKEYKLICYINFEVEDISEKFNIEFREYYNKSKYTLYKQKRGQSPTRSRYNNLSFNKINIYKDLYDEFKKDFIWIDLDTIIYHDLSYINNIDNCFIENGGNCTRKNLIFLNNKKITVPRKRYIQGNFWKLNIKLYTSLIETLDEIIKNKLQLRFDLQDLFNYHIYIKNKGKLDNINIIGYNIMKHSINGLSIWDKTGDTHATLHGLNNLFIQDGKLKSRYFPDKFIHILSFTFRSLKKLINTKKFKELFG